MCHSGGGVRAFTNFIWSLTVFTKGKCVSDTTGHYRVQQYVCDSHIQHSVATCILMSVNDGRSSPQICRHWRRHQACTSCRSRRPSSPHQQHSGSHYGHTPEVHRSHPAQRGGFIRLSFFYTHEYCCQTNHISHRPGRSQHLPSCCRHRTCCHPVSLRKRGELYISPGRSGEHEHPAAGWYRTSLRQEESQLHIEC